MFGLMFECAVRFRMSICTTYHIRFESLKFACMEQHYLCCNQPKVKEIVLEKLSLCLAKPYLEVSPMRLQIDSDVHMFSIMLESFLGSH